MWRFVPQSRAAVACAAALGGTIALVAGCNAGHLREEVGQQVRAIEDRLRGASARERYANDLRRGGDAGATLAQAWLAAGEWALTAPALAAGPLREVGTVSGDEPAALAWRMRASRGERVTVRVDTRADSGTRVFSELWREDVRDPSARQLIASGEREHVTYDATTDDAQTVYVLRVQPEAHRHVRWNVALAVGPSLAFPVEGKDARAIASGWGADRDGGARSHEGVDIMAPRGTPALAAEDGVVGYVGDDRLGGRVVSVAAAGRGHSLYYAHLDAQAVRAGQVVHTGDTVGFVGNTGNARGGPTHLHFGIYTDAGAVDPLPYLDDRRRAGAAPGRDTLLIGREVRTTARSGLALQAGPSASAPTRTTLAPRTVLAVEGAAGGGWLRVRLLGAHPPAVVGYVPADAVERVTRVVGDRAVSGVRDGDLRGRVGVRRSVTRALFLGE